MRLLLFIGTLALFPLLTAGEPNVSQDDPRPSIVYIVADDMRDSDFEYMPKTKKLIRDEGMSFENAFVTTSQCCPSRASMLRGQYAHNTGVKRNEPPQGGWQSFEPLEESTVATWLQNAGYRTALFHKYLNGHPPGGDRRRIPPGWDEWFEKVRGYHYYNYSLNENGRLVSYRAREADYSTDVIGRKAANYIQRHASDSAPFFMLVAPISPHDPYTVAPRHRHKEFKGLTVPRGSFNERDVSDKPKWVRDLPLLDEAKRQRMDSAYRKRLRMLRSVDDMVEGIVDELKAAGKLENTYIVFTSDNGFLLGEHRIMEHKNSPYEESIGVPLVIRGPGIPSGRTTEQMALNIDLAPTFANLAGASTPSFVDGRSLVPLFAADASTWRTAFLEEFYRGELVPPYTMVRTEDAKYVEYENGERELYDLSADPHELENLADKELSAAETSELESRLEALRECSAESCRKVEDQ
jgi:N-acetylglucosamine-6-sulfatase